MNERQLDSLYDFTLLLGLFSCVAMLGLGHVEPNTSYGLREIIAIIGVLAGARSQKWSRKTDG
jgi:hypothetical protein